MHYISRREKITSLLKQRKKIHIRELSDTLNISQSTLHRDLNKLVEEGKIKREHGLIIFNSLYEINSDFKIRLNKNVDLKNEIAKKSLKYIENTKCIFIDNSTTCFYLAKKISESEIGKIIIITNSRKIPELFIKNNNINIISTGGLYLREFDCFIGSIAVDTIRKFNGDIFFFSTGAISDSGVLSDVGVTGSNEIKEEMMKRSKKNICLIDSTKFENEGPENIFSLSEIQIIITDKNIKKEIIEDFKENKKVELIV